MMKLTQNTHLFLLVTEMDLIFASFGLVTVIILNADIYPNAPYTNHRQLKVIKLVLIRMTWNDIYLDTFDDASYFKGTSEFRI